MNRRNVDRLFAIWQALNPTSYTINKPTNNGTFTTRARSIETANTPLTPFADSTGTKYWTAAQVQNTQTFNYAYPETQRWKFANTAAYQDDIESKVQQLYGGVANEIRSLMASSISTTAVAAPIAAPTPSN